MFLLFSRHPYRYALWGFLLLAAARAAHAAEAPQLLPFQARLADAAGKPIPDGPAILQFQIFSEPAGGSPVWAGELHRVTVNGGLVNVTLGTRNPLPLNYPGEDRPFFGSTLYLQVTPDANGDGKATDDPPLLPRQAILPVLFAVEAAEARNAAKLRGYDWSVILVDGASDPATSPIDGHRIAGGSIGVNQIARNAGPLPGSIVAYGGAAVDEADGWLLCDGRAVSSQRYPRLFQAIRQIWGDGSSDSDPATDFNLPDLRGRSPLGAGQGGGLSDRSLGTKAGAETHRLTLEQVPAHEHFSFVGNNGTSPLSASNTPGEQGWSAVVSLPNVDFQYTIRGVPGVANVGRTSPTGGSQPFPILPPTLVVNFVIKD